MHTRDQLTKEQNDIIAFVKEKKKCGIFVTMGGGKTVVSLTVAADMLACCDVTKVLVLCTPTMVSGWANEVKKWDHLKDLKIKACEGSAQEKKTLMETDAKIHIISYQSMLSYFNPSPKEYRRFDWDMIIFDESTKIKSQSSKTFKTIKRITEKNWGRTSLEACMLLTGTPMANGYLDLWSQMYFVDGGKRLGKTITEYRLSYFQQAHYCKHVYEIIKGAEPIIKKKIKDVCYSLTTSNNPVKRTFTDKRFDLPQRALKYSEEIKEGILSINSAEIPAETPVKRLTKLLQIESGFIYNDDPVNRLAYHVHNSSIEALKEVIAERPGKNFMIAYSFKEDEARIKEALPGVVKYEKTEDLDNWNKRKIKYFLAHPKRASHGINAQFGGSVLVWYGLTWSLEEYLQMNARLARPGQTEDVEIVRIIANGGINQRIASVIGNKDKTQREVMEYLEKELSF